jgi:hypothetical protein
MRIVLSLAVWIAVVGGAYAAEGLSTRYGFVALEPIAPSSTAIRFSNHSIYVASGIEPADVSLFRVRPSGSIEYVIAQFWQPGLNCHYSFVVVSIRANHTFASGPRFGSCSQLIGAHHTAHGIEIQLQSTVRSVGVNPIHTYSYVDSAVMGHKP